MKMQMAYQMENPIYQRLQDREYEKHQLKIAEILSK